MAILVADAIEELKVRAKLGTHGAVPSDPELSKFVRDAFVTIIAAVPPILKAAVTLDSNRRASLPDHTLLVQFAAAGSRLLQDTEWEESGDSIAVQFGSADAGHVIALWYQLVYQIDSSDTEIDTTCIFGQDWLAEPALVLATMNVRRRLSASSASRSGGTHAQWFRVEQQERQALLGPLIKQRDDWLSRRLRKLEAQIGLGVLPPVPKRSIINQARLPNNLTGDLS